MVLQIARSPEAGLEAEGYFADITAENLEKKPLQAGFQALYFRRDYCGCSSVVERHVANVTVVGSNPITRCIRGRA